GGFRFVRAGVWKTLDAAGGEEGAGMRKRLIPQRVGGNVEQRHQKGGRAADQDRIARDRAAERNRAGLESAAAALDRLRLFCGASHSCPLSRRPSSWSRASAARRSCRSRASSVRSPEG